MPISRRRNRSEEQDMPSIERLAVGGSTRELHIARPAGAAPVPAIVYLYHREGVDEFTHQVMRRFVDAGYLIAVPDVSHHCDPAIPMSDRKGHLRDSQIVADIEATLRHLETRSDLRKDRIAIAGHCMGGRMAYLGASRLHGFRACVVFYGGGMLVSWNESVKPVDLVRDIACPVIGFFGNLDKNPSPEEVNKVEAELQQAGVSYAFHRYDGVGHGFQNLGRDATLDRAAAQDAWNKAFGFLAEHMAGAGADAHA
jgi:carboxymethylenebutenolidase